MRMRPRPGEDSDTFLQEFNEALENLITNISLNDRGESAMTPEERKLSEDRARKVRAEAFARARASVERKAKARIPQAQAKAERHIGSSIKVALGVGNILQIGKIIKLEVRHRIEERPTLVRVVFFFETLIETKDGRKIYKSLKPF